MAASDVVIIVVVSTRFVERQTHVHTRHTASMGKAIDEAREATNGPETLHRIIIIKYFRHRIVRSRVTISFNSSRDGQLKNEIDMFYDWG